MSSNCELHAMTLYWNIRYEKCSCFVFSILLRNLSSHSKNLAAVKHCEKKVKEVNHLHENLLTLSVDTQPSTLRLVLLRTLAHIIQTSRSGPIRSVSICM